MATQTPPTTAPTSEIAIQAFSVSRHRSELKFSGRLNVRMISIDAG